MILKLSCYPWKTLSAIRSPAIHLLIPWIRPFHRFPAIMASYKALLVTFFFALVGLLLITDPTDAQRPGRFFNRRYENNGFNFGWVTYFMQMRIKLFELAVADHKSFFFCVNPPVSEPTRATHARRLEASSRMRRTHRDPRSTVSMERTSTWTATTNCSAWTTWPTRTVTSPQSRRSPTHLCHRPLLPPLPVNPRSSRRPSQLTMTRREVCSTTVSDPTWSSLWSVEGDELCVQI